MTDLRYEEDYQRTRFEFDKRREVLWKTLCDGYFNQLITPDATVVELGAGYCHFINNVHAKRRIAVDLWPGLRKFAQPGVEAVVGTVANLEFLQDQSVDFVFASNLFEHLTQEDLAHVLRSLRRTLRPSGALTILQPNYRRAYREYFDDYTHITIYSDVSLSDFLVAHGFQVRECHPGFLPLTVKSRWPIAPVLIRLYLASPFKPFAKQMLIRAVPA